jgi:DNA topoisomerase-3
MGKPFAAMVKLTPELKAEFDFGQNGADANGVVPEIDFTGQEPLGPCPKCGARVFEHVMSYVCEKSTGANKSCDFRSGKIILQRPIEREQMTKLLTTGRTDLLQKFISKRNNRPFAAFLVKQPDGKIGWEFAPRPPKQPKKKAATPVPVE